MPIEIQSDTVEIALRKLKARENSFRRLEAISRFGSWEVDLITKQSSWSKQSYKIYGYEPNEIQPTLETFFSLLLPKYVEPAKKLLHEMMLSNEVQSFQAKVQKKDGSIIDVWLNAQVVNDENGNPLKLIGTTQDITKYVSLQQEANELLDILEKSSNEIYILDIDSTNYLYVNDGATKRLGYTKDELYKMQVYDINPYLSVEDAQKIRDRLLEQGSVINRTIHKTKSGELYPVQSYLQPITYKGANAFIIFDTDIASLVELEQQQQENARLLEYQANHDALTDLPNRLLFNDRLKQAIYHAKRSNEKFVLLFVDLDRFKQINDSFGHQFGDKVLLEVAHRLKTVIREADTLARIGGDEFTIIAKNIQNKEDVRIVANKVLGVLRKPMKIDSREVYTSISIGACIYPDDAVSEINLIKYADSAMYRAKEEGRDNYKFYSCEMTDITYEKVVIENSLRGAIESGEFEVYFQPQIDSHTQKVIGAEALVRWVHPELGVVAPSRFIGIAEESGLITKIDRIVMDKAMQLFSNWKKMGLEVGKLSLNLAMKQLLEDDFLSLVRANIKKYNFLPEWLEFEVTEGEVMKNPSRSIEILHALHDEGITIAIDDFGTGYSSLSYLTKLPLDRIKIDRVFINDIAKDNTSMEIINTIIVLAKSLEFDIIAEGVETAAQLKFLQEKECKNIQGFFYSKPLSHHHFEKFVQKQ